MHLYFSFTDVVFHSQGFFSKTERSLKVPLISCHKKEKPCYFDNRVVCASDRVAIWIIRLVGRIKVSRVDSTCQTCVQCKVNTSRFTYVLQISYANVSFCSRKQVHINIKGEE